MSVLAPSGHLESHCGMLWGQMHWIHFSFESMRLIMRSEISLFSLILST